MLTAKRLSRNSKQGFDKRCFQCQSKSLCQVTALAFSSHSSSVVYQQVLREKERKKNMNDLYSCHPLTFEMLLGAGTVHVLCILFELQMTATERSDLAIEGIVSLMERSEPVDRCHSAPHHYFFHTATTQVRQQEIR